MFPNNEFDFILLCYKWVHSSKMNLIQNKYLRYQSKIIEMGFCPCHMTLENVEC